MEGRVQKKVATYKPYRLVDSSTSSKQIKEGFEEEEEG